MADFIDLGDNCSDGPPSSIGEYDVDDSLIDDGSEHPSPGLFVREWSSSVVPTTEVVSSPRDGRRRHKRRRHSRTVQTPPGETASPDPDVRHDRRQRQRSIFSGSQQSSVRRQRRRTGGRSVRLSSEQSVQVLRDLDQLRRSQGSSSSATGRSTPDAQQQDENYFEFPKHLDISQLKGIALPSKRLGRNNPRWASRYFIFTFAQCGYTWPFENFEKIVSVLGGKCKIGRERHTDGGYHYHCFVDFERKFDFESPHRFCIGQKRIGSSAVCPGQAHCNIRPVPRTPYYAWDYVGKDDDVVFCNLERPIPRGGNATRDDLWKGSLALANKNDVSEDLQKHSPRDCVLFHRQISSFLDLRFGATKLAAKCPKENIQVNWHIYPEAREWVLRWLQSPIERIQRTSRGDTYTEETKLRDEQFLANYNRGGRPKSLLIYGGTTLGKSDFAKSLGFHFHWQKTSNLSKLLEMDMSQIEYGIFDDIPWTDNTFQADGFKAWLGGHEDFETTEKCKGKFHISWGKPAIVLCNKNPLGDKFFRDPCDREWLLHNCTLLYIGEKQDGDRSNAISSDTTIS
jgi:hypothetical protein